MLKRILSLAIALMLIISMAAVAASAAQVEISENAAETPAEIGAESGADTGAESGADTGASSSKIYFDANTSGWNNFKLVMIYLYIPETDEKLVEWGSKKKGGLTDEGGGIWSFDFEAKGHTLDPSTQYCLIFLNDNGMQTCDLLMDTTCLGDTAVCESDKFLENTDDSNKKSVVVRWKNNSKLGPKKAITSLGHIVGEVVPAFTSPYKMFVDFLANSGAKSLANAILYSDGKSAQEVIDEAAENLGLQRGDVKKAIAEAASTGVTTVAGTETRDWSADWSEAHSSLPEGENEEVHNTGDGGNDGGGSGSGGSGSGNGGSGSGSGGSGSGSNDSGSGSGSDSGSGSGSGSSGSGSGSGSSGSGSSGSGSSGATGSGSGSKTGQETTVVFILLGVMIAAAAVIVISRKKNRS